MKIYITFFILLLIGFSSKAQIGVNTDNPRQLFHLDGASTPATTNPTTGNVSAAQAADDVVIDDQGRVGIGTVNPTAKLHINNSSGINNSLKIVDGTEGFSVITNAEGVSVDIPFMLSSDDNLGTTRWIAQPESAGFIDHIGHNITFPSATVSLLSSYATTAAGNYLITIRWWGFAEDPTTPASVAELTMSAYFRVSLTDPVTNTETGILDTQEYYVSTLLRNPFCFTTTMYVSVPMAGRIINLYIFPRTQHWLTRNAINPVHLPSIVYFKI